MWYLYDESALLLILHEEGIRLKLVGNEVCYTNALMLLGRNMLCCKFHCQKGFNPIIFSYAIAVGIGHTTLVLPAASSQGTGVPRF